MATSTVRFLLTAESFAETQARFWEEGAYGERDEQAARARDWTVVAATAFLASLGLFAVPTVLDGDRLPLIFSAVVAGIAVLRKVGQRRHAQAMHRAASAAACRRGTRFPAYITVEGETEISVDATGVEYNGRWMSTSFRWGVVAGVRRVGADLLVWTLNGWTIAVPRSGFNSDADAAAFADAAMRFYEASGGWLELIASYLADRDLACAKCGYALRGVRRATCPECGRKAEFPDLVRATSADPRADQADRTEGAASSSALWRGRAGPSKRRPEPRSVAALGVR